ncbi:MAG: hypothetical protein GY753_14285 [Gammaproteobacteria bacterium]|nr:hypothetical protein [Gammaproteobacteria bacterium]
MINEALLYQLVTMCGNASRIASVFLRAKGKETEFNVLDVAPAEGGDAFTQMGARLALPYEFGIRSVLIAGLDVRTTNARVETFSGSPGVVADVDDERNYIFGVTEAGDD